MKHFGKKLMALCLSLALTLSLGVVASAATATSTPYGLTMKDKTMSFTQNGKVIGTFKARDNKVILTTDKDGDFTANYYDANNVYRAVNLGAQTTVTVSGKLDTLTVSAALADKIAVTVGANTEVTTMQVSSPNPIRIEGKVGTLTVSAAAKVTLASSAKVTSKAISKSATLTTEKGAQSGSNTTTPSTPAKKPAASTSNGTLKLKIASGGLDADDGDRLRDLEDDLNDAVYAYDSKTKEDVYGTAEWSSSTSRELTDDGTFSFTFYPDDSNYNSLKGSIKIYVDGASGDLDLDYDDEYDADDETVKMGEILDWLNDHVIATDDNDDDVDGKCRWSYSKNDKASNRTYKFTFKPDSSRYDDTEGSITVINVPRDKD